LDAVIILIVYQRDHTKVEAYHEDRILKGDPMSPSSNRKLNSCQTLKKNL